MVEPISIIGAALSGVLLHAGKKVFNRFWDYRFSPQKPIVNQMGMVSYADYGANGRTLIRKEITIPRFVRQYGRLFGNYYIPNSLDWTMGEMIALVLVIGDDNRNTFLFESGSDGYQIDLPYDAYTIFIFLIDPYESYIFDAEIYAVGFHTVAGFDLTGFDYFEPNRDIWNYIDTNRIIVNPGKASYLDFIFIDTDQTPSLPKYFYEIIG